MGGGSIDLVLDCCSTVLLPQRSIRFCDRRTRLFEAFNGLSAPQNQIAICALGVERIGRRRTDLPMDAFVCRPNNLSFTGGGVASRHHAPLRDQPICGASRSVLGSIVDRTTRSVS